MKAKIISTGEIIDFKGSSIEHGTSTWIDSNNIYHQGEFANGGIEILEKDSINWEQRRYEIAKSAMNSLLCSSSWQKIREDGFRPTILVDDAIVYADELIKQLKKGNLVIGNINDEIIIIENTKFLKGDICEIYDIERDKKMFLNREAGFIIKTFGDENNPSKSFKFGEKISYESSPNDISEVKNKWLNKMNEAIKLWKNK